MADRYEGSMRAAEQRAQRERQQLLKDMENEFKEILREGGNLVLGRSDPSDFSEKEGHYSERLGDAMRSDMMRYSGRKVGDG